MRIAWVIERMNAARGGRERSTAQVAAALADRGHQVTILCQQGSLDDQRIQVKALGRRGLTRGGRLARFIADVQAEMASGRYDLVHATLPVPGAHVYQVRGGTIPAQRDASLRRRSPLLGPALRALERLNRHRARMGRLERQVVADPQTLILPVSRMVATELAHYYGRRDDVVVVPNGVDAPPPDLEDRADWRQQSRYRLGVVRDDTVFVVIATNFELKGVDHTIAAFAQWYHSRRRRNLARLVIVGRELAEGYQRFAGMREVGMAVHFAPPCDNVFQWLAPADACVLLSWYDPCSRVLLEAARWGIPSLTTAYNGAAELLGHGCIVVDSPRARRQIVAGLAEPDDPQRRAVRSAACRAVAPGLGVERHVERLLEIYADLPRRP